MRYFCIMILLRQPFCKLPHIPKNGFIGPVRRPVSRYRGLPSQQGFRRQ
jgi:hypothetical protein